MRILLGVVVLLLAGCQQPAPAAAPLELGSLSVQVLGTEWEALSDVTVHVIEANRTDLTGPLGRTEFVDLIPGRYNVTASKIGLVNASVFVDVVPGELAYAQMRLLEPPPKTLQRTWGYRGEASCAGRQQRLPFDPEPCPPRRIPDVPPDGNYLPPWIQSLELSLNWTGPIKEFEATLFFGNQRAPRPFANGDYNLTARGAAPLSFLVPPEWIWGPLRRGGSLEIVVQPRDAPPEFDQPYTIEGRAPFVFYVDEETAPRWQETEEEMFQLRPNGRHVFAPNETAEYTRFGFVVQGDCYQGQQDHVVLVFNAADGYVHRAKILDSGNRPYVTTCVPPPVWGPTVAVYLPPRPGPWPIVMESACTCSVKATPFSGRIVASDA